MNPQPKQALKLANATRTAKSEVKAMLRSGEADFALTAQTTTLPFRVDEIIRQLPGFGDAAARRVCRSVGVRGDRRLDTLTDRQREQIGEIVGWIRWARSVREASPAEYQRRRNALEGIA